jgi:uncharacterized protein (TIGR01370 family)
VREWVCYYGPRREILERSGADCFVLEADRLGAPVAGKDGRITLAYLSIGEVHQGRACWSELAGTPAVLPVASAWSGSRRTDPRSSRWQAVVLRESERLLAMGYSGFFLDTVDQAAALEEEDPEAFAGAQQATADLVRALRRRHPEAYLMVNGGFAVLDRIASSVDAVAVEGLRATHEGPEGDCRPRTEAERAWLAVQLRRLEAEGLPVFALEYAPETVTTDDLKRMTDAVERLGARPAVGHVDLTTWPPGIDRGTLAETGTSPGGG